MNRRSLIIGFAMVLFFISLFSSGRKQTSSANTLFAQEITQTPASDQQNNKSEAVDFDGMAPDIAKIIERGQLIIAIPSIDQPLFYELDSNGEMSGFDIELAKALADRLGVEAVFERSAQNFSQLTDNLKNGKADLIISTFSITPERAKYINFSDPYIITYMSLLVSKQKMVQYKIESDPIGYIKSNPVKIGVVSGTSHYDLAETLFPKAELVPLKDYAQAYEKIISGEIFAYLSNELELLFEFVSNPEIALYAAVYSFTDLKDQFCVGVSYDTPQLLNFVNSYINTEKMTSSDEIEKAYRERHGEMDQK